MDAGGQDRLEEILGEIYRIDAVDLLSDEGSGKHADMAASPFAFYRGTASLFYRDLKAGGLDVAVSRRSITRIQGDSHLENFGFLTEGGAWAAPHHVVFCPNDFDDAGVGHAEWDLMRYAVSLFLAADRASCDNGGIYVDWPHDRVARSPGFAAARTAAKRFFKTYRRTCKIIAERPDDCWDEAVCNFGSGHFLHAFEKKAKSRAVRGDDFATKSKLARAVDLTSPVPRFAHAPGRLERLLGPRATTLVEAFRPYVDDAICDAAMRFGAGLGARQADRYYFLVGPDEDARDGQDWRQILQLYHLVEVKEQRPPAFLPHFPDIDPANRMSAAHLVIDCQRLMQRRPDRILDSVSWNDRHWLMRTRHHSKVGVDAEELGHGDLEDNLVDHAEASARALALAHGRSDKRSRLFECHMIERLRKDEIHRLVDAAEAYAARVVGDWAMMRRAQ
jgi:hypothetical protein